MRAKLKALDIGWWKRVPEGPPSGWKDGGMLGAGNSKNGTLVGNSILNDKWRSSAIWSWSWAQAGFGLLLSSRTRLLFHLFRCCSSTCSLSCWSSALSAKIPVSCRMSWFSLLFARQVFCAERLSISVILSTCCNCRSAESSSNLPASPAPPKLGTTKTKSQPNLSFVAPEC